MLNVEREEEPLSGIEYENGLQNSVNGQRTNEAKASKPNPHRTDINLVNISTPHIDLFSARDHMGACVGCGQFY